MRTTYSPALVAARVLLVKAPSGINARYHRVLETAGASSDVAYSLAQARALASSAPYDAAIFFKADDALCHCEACRLARVEIVLVANERQALHSIGKGANHAQYTEVAPAELVTRLGAHLLGKGSRRCSGPSQGALSIDLASRQVMLEGSPVPMYPACKVVLERLLRHAPNVVSRPELAHALWGDVDACPDLLRSHIYETRRAFARAGAPVRIVTLNMVGYRLEAASRPSSAFSIGQTTQ